MGHSEYPNSLLRETRQQPTRFRPASLSSDFIPVTSVQLA